MTNGLFRVASAIPHGVSAQPVFLDVHVAQGLPSFTIVGVADEGCRNTRDRIRAAVINSGFQWPARRVTVGVSPTGVTPPTAVLDLPIALALLTATSQLTIPSGHEMITAFGELGLDGSVRPVVGHLPILRSVEGEKFRVVNLTLDRRGVELEGVEVPLRIFVSLDQLAEAFATLEKQGGR